MMILMSMMRCSPKQINLSVTVANLVQFFFWGGGQFTSVLFKLHFAHLSKNNILVSTLTTPWKVSCHQVVG